MRFVAFCCVLACLILAMAAPATARLRVHDAELSGGRIIVTGSTARRHQVVTLNASHARTSEQDCVVSCNDGEFVVNAFCPKRTAAALTAEREVSCGTGNDGTMIAYCAR